MKGFNKVIKFKIEESYENARKIADDIIVSLTKNTSKDGVHIPTFVSTITETSYGKTILRDGSKILLDSKDKEVSEYIIEIFVALGNRRSKLSISQNETLMEKVL